MPQRGQNTVLLHFLIKPPEQTLKALTITNYYLSQIASPSLLQSSPKYQNIEKAKPLQNLHLL